RARRRRRRHTDSPFPEGTVATVVRPGSRGLVRVGGELWNARPTGEGPLLEGQRVKIVGQDGLLLLVNPELGEGEGVRESGSP
ncbi:MAG: NfeD family protein, partial [Firmicutes bacterium]|nr:NfeD family protein [Bacillota bacterium]